MMGGPEPTAAPSPLDVAAAAVPACPFCGAPAQVTSFEEHGRTLWVWGCAGAWQDPPVECPVMPCTRPSRDHHIAFAHWSERAGVLADLRADLAAVDRGTRALMRAVERIRGTDARVELAYNMGLAQGELRGAAAYKDFIARALKRELDAPLPPAPPGT